MSRNLKRVLTFSSAVLMLAGIGASSTGSMASANQVSHTKVSRTNHGFSNKMYTSGYRDALDHASLNYNLASKSKAYERGWISGFTPNRPVLNAKKTKVLSKASAQRVLHNRSVKMLSAGMQLAKKSNKKAVYMIPTQNGSLNWSTSSKAPKINLAKSLDPSTYYMGYTRINRHYRNNKAYRIGLNDFYRSSRLNLKLAKTSNAYRAGWIIGFDSLNGKPSGVDNVNPEMHPLSYWTNLVNSLKHGVAFGQKHHAKKYDYYFDHWTTKGNTKKARNHKVTKKHRPSIFKFGFKIPKATKRLSLKPAFYAHYAHFINSDYAKNKSYRAGLSASRTHSFNTTTKSNVAYRMGWIMGYTLGISKPSQYNHNVPTMFWKAPISDYKSGIALGKKFHKKILYYYPATVTKRNKVSKITWYWSSNKAKGDWGYMLQNSRKSLLAKKTHSQSTSRYNRLVRYYLQNRNPISYNERSNKMFKKGRADARSYKMRPGYAPSKAYRDGWILAHHNVKHSVKVYLNGLHYANAHHATKMYLVVGHNGHTLTWSKTMLKGSVFLKRVMHRNIK